MFASIGKLFAFIMFFIGHAIDKRTLLTFFDFYICHSFMLFQYSVSDICIGGLFPKGDIFDYAVMSVTYDTDDLNLIGTWFLVIFGYGYTGGFVLYLLIPFDRKYEQRNNRDWHFTTWLVLLPADMGLSPNFRPVGWTTRIFFGLALITAFFYFQIIFTRWHEFVHMQIPRHQISSLKELMQNDFKLAGSTEVLNLLHNSKEISGGKTESFLICEHISECFVQLMEQNNLAIGGSRQNILNSPFISHSKIFCFKDLESIASYPVSLYMRKDWHLKGKINQILQRLFEAGFFVKWKRDSRLEPKYEETATSVALPLTVAHVSASIVFIYAGGSMISISTFVAENIVSWKMKQKVKRKIWVYLEYFFDGERHYFRNVPERLGMGNRTIGLNFPYLE